MNRNLLGDLKIETSPIFVENGCRKQGRGLLGLLLMAFFAVFLNENAVAQTDYSGTYYIGSNGYVAGNTTTNYYLCPTEGWAFLETDGNPGTVTGDDNGKPFLTTYQCRNGAYDATKAVWTIVKEPNSGYYYIIQASTGRYMLSNGPICGNPDRARVHLETISDPNDLDDKALFNIYLYSGHLVIRPMGITDGNSSAHSNHSTHKWLTVNQGNQPTLVGTIHKTDGPSGFPNTGGIIGIYVESDSRADFYLENYSPFITFNASNLIEIKAAPSNATLIYTTDGTTPTVSPLNGTAVNSNTVSFDPDDNVTTIKAIAIVNGVASDVATFTPPVLLGSTHKRLIQSQNNAWNTTDFHFYMIPGDEANGVLKVNTTSLFRPSMEWHFLNAGNDNLLQYYYIVNNNGKYLCYNSTNVVFMDDYDEDYDDSFKFSIVESSTYPGTFNIKPYGQNILLCKQTDNASVNPIYTVGYSANNANSGNARWRFILPAELDTAPPFTPFDPSTNTCSYFKIASVGSSGYFIIPPTGSAINATTSNSEDPTIVNTMNWYFEVAQAADGSDWLTYYHIRNAVTGDYLYFTKDDNNQGACLEMRRTIVPEAADRYMFTWARTAPNSSNVEGYYIIPKLLKDKSQNQFSTLRRNNNTLQTSLTRGAGNYAWTFESSSYTCETPEITINASQGTATFTCATPGAQIYYVRYNSASGADPDLTDPTISATLTLYDGTPVDMGTYSYIKAIAARDANGGDQSAVADAAFQCLTPTITFNYNTRVLTISSTVGSTIYYTTDGVTNPTVNESIPHGTSPVSFSLNEAATIKAIAIKGEGTLSSMAETTINKVETPVFIPEEEQVTIICPTPGVSIYYEIGAEGSVPDPTTSSTLYTGPITNVSGMSIKAFAVRYGWIASDVVESGIITLKCATPVIRRGVNDTFTIECSFPTEGVEIRYTIDGSTTPNANSPLYQGPVNISSYPITVKAIAIANGYDDSQVATQTITENLEPEGGWYEIASAGDFNLFVNLANTVAGAGYNYRVTDNFTVSNPAAITQTFTGTFDGGLYTISGMRNPLFASTNGAIVRNVMLKDVTISEAGNVGSIVCEAKGYTRIYNCGILPNNPDFSETGANRSSVASTGGSGSAGSIVGKLEDDSRVVNCFSYADVSSTGYAAGIVGNNTFASNASVTSGKYTKLCTMVVNCIFYGDIKSGNSIWPVYGGQKITNAGSSGINNYNFYSDSCHFANPLEGYNCSWPARYEYLTRYEFHRYLLNSNRELCGWWVGAPSPPSTMTTAQVQAVPKDASLMAKWVLAPEEAPYPILKPSGYYPSFINKDVDAAWRVSANEWEGKNLGTLVVTVKSGDQYTASDVQLSLIITDMDTLREDYCYRKVQLPYYNTVFGNPSSTDWTTKYAGNYTQYAVTGWEITDVTGGSEGTYLEDWQDGYNFADRECTKKDKYSVSGRIFAQGGFYYVPNGVTAITIKAHWANAYYIGNGDYYYDRVNFKHDNNQTGTAFSPAGIRSDLTQNNGVYTLEGNGQTVRTGKIKAVADDCGMPAGSVFDNALILIGNHQYCTGGQDVDPSCSFTLMSPDFDFDNEPDYCLDWQLGVGTSRQQFCPLRIDFLPVVEIGLGLKKDGSTQYYSLGCYRPLGHFEVTETALIRFGQFEFSNKNRTEYAPLILNGGIYEQYVKSTNGQAVPNADDKIDYIILGGNVYMFGFTPGAHVSYAMATRHCAVNAIGGKFKKFFLTGYFNEDVSPNQDNPHAYIDGGWFDHMASAGKEGIYGDVTWRINHARINEFYGGGVMAKATDNNYKIVKGSIKVVIDHSIVHKYCGGPKFGDMVDDKTVTTNATGTTFGVYYGAGNGGTNYVQYEKSDGTYPRDNQNFTWEETGKLDQYTPGTYRDRETGYQADYELEMINVSTGTLDGNVVIRTYFFAGQFATTNTGAVFNTLDSCIVKGNFYGGGLLGGVKDDVTSKLTDTEVRGSVYGGGYSASVPEVKIYNKDKSYPTVDLYTGYITPSEGGTCTTYKWSNDPSLSTGSPAGDGIFFTEVPLVDLGMVNGNVTLTIKGNSTIGTMVNNTLKPNTGNVFGGGEESTVAGNTVVKLHDGTHVFGNVFGGGNKGAVRGDSSVTIEPAP